MKKVLLAASFGVAALMSTSVAVAEDGGSGPDFSQVDVVPVSKSGVYIVVLEGDPVVAYDGGVNGLKPTKPAAGKKVNRKNADVKKYAAHLDSTQNSTLAAAGVPTGSKLVSYRYAANGFSAKLTPAQAEAVAAQPGVLLVMPDTLKHIDRAPAPSSSSAAFLDLTGKKAAFDSGLTGEGVVIGVIDTGIWPEHPSLNPAGYGPAPAGFSGIGCDFGNTGFNADDAPFVCNAKLLAAKSYGVGFHGGTGVDLATGSYLSARDEDGHGTHTATTAGGNANVAASIYGTSYGTVTGIAPRARISVYKACWSSPGGDGCASSDLVAAIDAAVADGVDVINYSIGSDTAAIGADDISFLFANDAGVYVARSAGNAGPDAGTVGNAATTPWATTVGASTTDNTFESTVTLGNGQVFRGASVTGGAGPAPIVDAGALGNELCLAGTPFADDVTGKIVLCKRGVSARVEKSEVVLDAGGVGMVLYNAVAAQEVVTDNHFLPSSHLSFPDGVAVKDYITAAGAGAMATLSSGARAATQGSVMAAFSSRGPNSYSEDLLTPDVTAPGVNILAGNTPTALLSAPGQLFQSISGTSMSSPHVAGIFALMTQAHPDWTPAAARSALMTTARQDVKKEDGSTKADPFDMGAGHVRPGGDVKKKGSLFNPGVVYDAGFFEYYGSLCETAAFLMDPADCAFLDSVGVPITAENLNQASISVGDIAGFATVTRTLTNVSGKKLDIDAKVKAPKGFKVEVSPKKLKLAAGESKSFTVTITRTKAAYDTWSFGDLTWEGGGYKARSPIAVKATEFAAPAVVTGAGATSSVDVPVKFGYTGAYSATVSGAVSANETPGVVLDDPNNDINQALANGDYIEVEVNVPAGTAFTRFAIRNADVTGFSDIDLYVFDDFGFVGASGSGSSHETVDLVAPAAGTYYVVIHGWQTDGPDSTFVLYDWSVPFAPDGGSLGIGAAPGSATMATTGAVTVNWTGIDDTKEQMGVVVHNGPGGVLAVTGVELNVID